MLCTLAGTICVILLLRWLFDPLRRIPGVGSSLPVLSYLGTFRFIFHAKDMLQEGYDKYPVFRLAMLNRWVVVVSGAKMNEELLGLGDDRVSFDEALHELVDPELTISWEAYKYPIHVDAMKQWLPRNSARLFPAILEEVERALEELIPDSETAEWLPVHAYPTVTKIVVRASNRLFVGAPLCRNTEYLDIMRVHAANVDKAATILTLCPKFLKP
ncbi:hypothetical protein EVJ58_g8754 [Rhodofomes roseus]|uniref:Cytochrome P450 n=1 Tax=Rhodofomes roseus TaxID=34475 RepID=A0A4Y9Y187_9APHY|nr:hypothetical protein EVJ58_g8754 [Rhodofomes roseus]